MVLVFFTPVTFAQVAAPPPSATSRPAAAPSPPVQAIAPPPPQVPQIASSEPADWYRDPRWWAIFVNLLVSVLVLVRGEFRSRRSRTVDAEIDHFNGAIRDPVREVLADLATAVAKMDGASRVGATRTDQVLLVKQSDWSSARARLNASLVTADTLLSPPTLWTASITSDCWDNIEISIAGLHRQGVDEEELGINRRRLITCIGQFRSQIEGLILTEQRRIELGTCKLCAPRKWWKGS